jgi:hypothetical protein
LCDGRDEDGGAVLSEENDRPIYSARLVSPVQLRRSLVIMESSIQHSHDGELFAHRISRCILARRCEVAYLLRAA